MTFHDNLLDRFQELHADVAKVLDGLPSGAIDWSPGAEMNPIGVLVVHLLGAERYWIGVALDNPPDRNREAEFKSPGLDADSLTSALKAQDAFVQDAMRRLARQDLNTLRRSPRNNKEFTIGWCLTHALEHTALHLGHLQLTRQLWLQRNP